MHETAAHRPGEPAATRVLFVGNSFVSRNDLPSMVANLARAAGHRMESESIVAGGASLRRHLNAGRITHALETARWDQVVLQEQSTLPVKNPARYHENVRSVLSLPGVANVRTVLYMTWAQRSAPQSQQQLTSAVQAIGAETGAAIAPVGVAWHRVLSDHPEISLHAADGIHPNRAGSWLAACVIYRSLFRDPDLPAPTSSGLSLEVMAVIADAARRAIP